MTQPQMPKTVTIAADIGWQLPITPLFVLGLLLMTYRLCVVQSVQQNGRVVTQCRWPIQTLLKGIIRRISRHEPTLGTSMNPQLKTCLYRVYNGQNTAFGVFIYCLGVSLFALATSQFADAPVLLSTANTLLCALLGAAAMIFGVFTVIRRHRDNPFAE